MASVDDHLPTEQFRVGPRAELRIEIGASKVYITVIKGEAEVFGAVVQPHNRMCLQNTKVAVFTWQGCSILMEGTPDETPYISDDTPMVSYLNAATIVNNQRNAVRKDGGAVGPCVVIVGPADSGKSCLAAILINYAIRAGWQPLLVDCDTDQGMVTLPGALCAAQVEVPIEPESGVYADAPLVFYYGHTSPQVNPDLYKAQVDRLGDLWRRRNEASSPSVRSAGTVINTLGWVDGPGRDLQLHVCRAFQASIIAVVGDDKLHSTMTTAFQGRPGVTVVKLPKSGGAVARSRECRKRARDRRVLQYFDGTHGELEAVTQQLMLKNTRIYKVSGNTSAHAGLLPQGASSVMNPLRVTLVEPSDDLVGHVLGVSFAATPEELVKVNVAGFVWVQQVDLDTGTISVRCPHGSAPPGSMFLLGSIKRSVDTFMT